MAGATRTIRRQTRRFLADERGATALEYGLICSLVFLVFAGAVYALSDTLMTNFWDKIEAGVVQANGG